MSEPIELFTVEGEQVIMYSPRVAQAMVEAGELFVAPPTIVEESPPEEKPKRGRPKETQE